MAQPWRQSHGHYRTTDYADDEPTLQYHHQTTSRPHHHHTTYLVEEPVRSSTRYTRDKSPSRYTSDSHHRYTRDLPEMQIIDLGENRTLDRYGGARETRVSTYDPNFRFGSAPQRGVYRDQAVVRSAGPGQIVTQNRMGTMADQRMAVNPGRNQAAYPMDHRMMYGPPLRAIFNPYGPGSKNQGIAAHPLFYKYGPIDLQPRYERVPA